MFREVILELLLRYRSLPFAALNLLARVPSAFVFCILEFQVTVLERDGTRAGLKKERERRAVEQMRLAYHFPFLEDEYRWQPIHLVALDKGRIRVGLDLNNLLEHARAMTTTMTVRCSAARPRRAKRETEMTTSHVSHLEFLVTVVVLCPANHRVN